MLLSNTPLDAERVYEVAGDDTSFLEELVDLYVSDSQAALDELMAFAGQQDPVGMRKTAHRLKGSSVNMGLVNVAVLAKMVEDAGKDDTCDAAFQLEGALGSELKRAHMALKGLLREAA
ncbi:MAG: Hpt domain-containing protein [Myxococcales bacterium]|nr:Hpt domain-containing protein [Myxococcales bacterium]MCB9645907.1 Hpt domain-containing protein [Deltaproteobacteria bacterium]